MGYRTKITVDLKLSQGKAEVKKERMGVFSPNNPQRGKGRQGAMKTLVAENLPLLCHLVEKALIRAFKEGGAHEQKEILHYLTEIGTFTQGELDGLRTTDGSKFSTVHDMEWKRSAFGEMMREFAKGPRLREIWNNAKLVARGKSNPLFPDSAQSD